MAFIQTQKTIPNILAGTLIGVINITVAISVAALVFTGLDSSFLAPGIVMLLIGTLVIGLGGTFLSDFPGSVCAPRSGLAPVFGAIVGGIYTELSGTAPDQALPTILVAIMVTSVVTGLVLLLLGQMKLGNLVRYIPYPVMGGFFAGIGYLFVIGGLGVAMGQPPGLSVLGDMHAVQLGLPALGLAIIFYTLLTKFEHWATFPVILLGGFIAFYATVLATGYDLSDAASAGWVPNLGENPGLFIPVVGISDLAKVDWTAILGAWSGILVVALLTAIMLLLDVSGIELITRQELNPDQELRVMGLSNIVSGIAAGFPGVHAASDTAFTYKLGGNTHLMGVVYATVVLLSILAGTDFIGKIPTFVLGGLLIYVGLEFLADWVWKARRELPLPDYLIVLAILGVIAAVDILEGVAFGFAIAVVLFVVNYAKISIIKNEATGREHASNIDRDLETREFLNRHGNQILILMIQGFVFFGTADKLISEIRKRVEESDDGIKYLVLDLHHVEQLDTSAIHAFLKLAQLSEKLGFHVLITGADRDTKGKLTGIDFMTERVDGLRRITFDQLDDGVAWCEERILKTYGHAPDEDESTLLSVLNTMMRNRDAAKTIASYFDEEHRSDGEYLFREGESGESMYLVGSGSVAVMIDVNGEQRVLRRYQKGAALGEMTLYTGNPRSASVLVEEDSVLYRLERENLSTMQKEHPEAASRFHSYVVELLAERLNRTNKELQRYL